MGRQGPDNFKLGSAQSRAAARAMLTGAECGELRFQVVSVVDGSRVNLDGLAEVIHAGRMRAAAALSGVDVARRQAGEEARLPSRAHTTGPGTGEAGARPGDFGLGSVQSRAAARALLDSRRAAKPPGTLLVFRTIGKPHDPALCTCPTPEAGTIEVCRCFL
jgi:hypothetical protein